MKDLFEAGRFLLGFGTISFILMGISYLDTPLSTEEVIASLAAGFFLTLGIYSFNHLTDYAEDKINKPDSILVSGRRTPLQVLAFSFVCKGLAAISALFLSRESFVLACILILVSFLYSYKFFGYRLKDIFVVKSLTVAGSYAAILGIPALATGAPISQGLVFIAFFVFSHILIGTIIADLADIDGDTKSGVKTIPAALGPEKTLWLLVALNTISFIALLASLFFWHLKEYLIILSWICLWRYYTFLEIHENKKQIRYIYAYMDNPTYAMAGALVLLAKFIGL